MVGHGELHHARGALLLGQFQTGAVPALEHAGLGVIVCGGLEFCTHRHSRQVGNSAAVLQGDRCIGDIKFIGLGSVLGVLRGQRDVVCGHREGNVRTVDVRISGQAVLLPASEGVTILLGCGNRDFLIICTQFWLPVHGQGVGVLLVLRSQRDVVCGHLEGNVRTVDFRISGQAVLLPASEGVTNLLGCGNRDFLTKLALFLHAVYGQGVGDRLIDTLQVDVVCRHRELDLDMRAGIGDGIRILCQSFDLPCDGIAFLLVSAKGDLIALITLHAVLSIPVVLRLGHNIGAYLVGDNIITVLTHIVLTRRHLDVHIVAAGGGGNSFALVGAVQQGHLRVGIVVICAGVFHLVRGGIVGKVLSLGRVAERFLTHNNRTGLVFFAFLCNDGYLIAAIRIRYLVGKGLAFVYTGNALKLSRKFANAVCLRADQRIGAILVLDAIKVLFGKALKGQLFSHGVAIRQLVIAAIVVLAILHHKPDVVGTCLGGHRFRSRRQVICSAVLKGSLRDCVAIILRAGIGCRTGVEVKAEVPYRRPIFAHNRFLCNQNAAGRVPLALRGLDVYLIAAVLGLGRDVVKLCVVVGAHTDNAQLANALLIAGNDRVLHSPVNSKVGVLQGREGQLFRDSISVHYVLGARVVVTTIIHHDVDVVGACLGGLRHRRGAILRDILDRIQRGIVKIHRAVIGCSLGLGVIRKVGEFRLISAYHLADIKRALRVLVALLRYDALLVDAV